MEIVTFGSNFYGQLGLGNCSEPDSQAQPRLFAEGSIEHSRVKDVQAGSLMTVMLDTAGQVAQCGSINGRVYNVLQPVEIMYPLKVTQVACGNKHILALLDGGYVCSWGTGYFGQLGHGDESSWDNPRVINSLEPSRLGGAKVTKVACGGNHSGCLVENGRIFMWGLNRNSQCGVNGHRSSSRDSTDTILEPRPTELGGLDGDVPTILVCGRNHSACIGSNGRVYTWGAASMGQQGINEARKKELYPKEVTYFRSKPILSLACGDFHTLALGMDCSVYSWGFNADGQCGHGNTINHRTPRRIDALDGQRIVSINCGSSWSSAITKAGDLFCWGYNDGLWTGVHPKGSLQYVKPDIVEVHTESSHSFSFDSIHNLLYPTLVDLQADHHVIKARAGGSHMFVFTRKDADAAQRRLRTGTGTNIPVDTDLDLNITYEISDDSDDDIPQKEGGNQRHRDDASKSGSRHRDSRSEMKSSSSSSSSKGDGRNNGHVLNQMSSQELEGHLLSWVRHKKLPELSYALNNGANINLKDEHGNTPLLVACQNGHMNVATLLINRGADVNLANIKGNTPLHYSLAYQHGGIAKLLVSKGADEYVLNKEGLSPYEGLTSQDLEML
jgi:alpha-tubulin suppressor-like RCC1 family protein